jgi:membrane associated rhomboid family serine protease
MNFFDRLRQTFGQYPVTLVLISGNVLIFGVLAIVTESLFFDTASHVAAMIEAGANFNPLTLGGEPWRLATSMFLHFGVIHLLVNMYGLWQLGQALEEGMGSLRFLLLYFICGLLASVASVYFNVLVVSAGASGAIFGLYGFHLGAAIIATYHDKEKLKQVLISFVIFVAINAFIAGQVNVDMSGHIGGAVAGFIIAACHLKFRILRTTAAMVMVMLLCPVLLFFAPTDQRDYYRQFETILKAEDEARELFATIKDERVLSDSLRRLSDHWRSINESLGTIAPPSVLANDHRFLRDYADLRSSEALFQSEVAGETYIYLDSLEAVHAAFDSLPKLERTFSYCVSERSSSDSSKADNSAKTELQLTAVKVFYDKDWKETADEDAAMYFRVGSQDSASRWQGAVRDYFKDGSIQMKGSYKNSLRDGVFIYYTERNTYSSAGRYVNDEAVGKWQDFHWNGRLAEEVYYEGRAFVRFVYDSLGNKLIDNGNGEYTRWYNTGQVRERGMYRNGARTGVWEGFYPDGAPYFKEDFEGNRLLRGMSLARDGRQFVYDGSSLFPTPASGLRQFRDYIEKEKRYPIGETKRGVVRLHFMVGVDGSLWDFVIIAGLSPALDAEAVRLVREGPVWRPALLHGQEKIASQGYAEVSF